MGNAEKGSPIGAFDISDTQRPSALAFDEDEADAAEGHDGWGRRISGQRDLAGGLPVNDPAPWRIEVDPHVAVLVMHDRARQRQEGVR